jgi:hypothetical protein
MTNTERVQERYTNCYFIFDYVAIHAAGAPDADGSSTGFGFHRPSIQFRILRPGPCRPGGGHPTWAFAFEQVPPWGLVDDSWLCRNRILLRLVALGAARSGAGFALCGPDWLDGPALAVLAQPFVSRGNYFATPAAIGLATVQASFASRRLGAQPSTTTITASNATPARIETGVPRTPASAGDSRT